LQTIGALRLESPSNLPPYFDIAYHPTSTGASRRYSFWGRILNGGKQFFITHQLGSALGGERAGETERPSRQTSSTTEAAYARSDLLGVLPATFVGSVPGADRPGIRYQLELFPHQAFFLRMTYLTGGNSLSFDNLGSWAVESDRRLLLLWSGREAPLELAIKDGNTLEKLDGKGREVASSVDYDLRRTRGLQPLEARVAMRGMYRYFADSGRFTECLTGQSWPVSRESDNAALLFAYSKARRHPGDEVLASLFGRVAAAGPTMEDAEQQRTLVVERFMGVWPDETCGAQLSTQSLGNTYWRLTRLGAIQLSEGLQQGEPHLILHSESRRVSGSVGCTRSQTGNSLGRVISPTPEWQFRGRSLDGEWNVVQTLRGNGWIDNLRSAILYPRALGLVTVWKGEWVQRALRRTTSLTKVKGDAEARRRTKRWLM
jgi:uncharacterized lipoprotein NlpE involved in copper resistance